MKRKQIFLAGPLFTISLIAMMAFNSPESPVQNFDITGTWRLDSYRYGNTGSFITVEQSRWHIKLITRNSFMWSIYDPSTKKILESAGGKYTLEGDNYTETIDYGYNMDTYLGTVSNFKINVGDGMFFMAGYLSDGYKIEEVWRKVE